MSEDLHVFPAPVSTGVVCVVCGTVDAIRLRRIPSGDQVRLLGDAIFVFYQKNV
jgi:hypothetical protein